MKQRMVDVIKKSPALYRCASKLYWALRPVHLAELLMGTRAREKHWARRQIAEGYWGNRDHPSKYFLTERIAAFAPIDSILEVGCASGPSLYLPAKKFPRAKIVGIDVNAEAVQYGNKRFGKEGISNVKLMVGKADELGEFQNGAFDIVFTNALLIYVGPDKIKEVIKEMIRITNKALVLMELHCFGANAKDPSGMGVYQGDNWLRDYASLLKQFVSAERVRVTRIPEGVWPVKPWNQWGAVIEVIL
jgi:predicted O-methyltransferase YrrM